MRWSRDLLVRALCVGVGIAAASGLSSVMRPNIAIVLPKAPEPVSVAVKVRAAPLPAAPAQAAPAAEKVLPLSTDKEVPAPRERTRPRKEPAKPPKESAAPAPVEAPMAPEAELPTIAQPAIELPAETQLSLDEVPPMPPEAGPGEARVRKYAEQPGGNTLVLGMLVNDRGVVIDSRILVPSFNGLTDLAVSLAAVGQTYTHVDPPLRYGETRWVELRIPFVDPTERTSVLP